MAIVSFLGVVCFWGCVQMEMTQRKKSQGNMRTKPFALPVKVQDARDELDNVATGIGLWVDHLLDQAADQTLVAVFLQWSKSKPTVLVSHIAI